MGNQRISPTETPGLPVFVEGSTDMDFISEINHQTKGIDLNISDCGGKDEVLNYIVMTSRIRIKRFCAFLDIDASDPESLLRRVQDKLDGNFESVDRISTNVFLVNGYSQVHVGCIGLHENKILQEYGVTRHAMEDHALNLLLTDEKIVPRLSETSVESLEEFKEALKEQKSSIEDYVGEINKSKTILKMALVLLGYDGGTGSFIGTILKCTEYDLDTHDSTKEVVDVFYMDE